MPPESITLRPVTKDDEKFLWGVYCSTRLDELRPVPWTEEEKVAFLTMQFRAQAEHYERVYEKADFLIIMRHGVDIGRLYIDRMPNEIHLIDIALLPEFRGGGIGAALMKEILEEGRTSGRKVTIYVENFNPARHLYDRLGFRHVDDNGVYHLMEWRADAPAEAPAK
jgi:ribosomal protein S18 acetylase RimI-like enzyme